MRLSNVMNMAFMFPVQMEHQNRRTIILHSLSQYAIFGVLIKIQKISSQFVGLRIGGSGGACWSSGIHKLL